MLGRFTLTVSRVETVPLTETFSRTGEGLGLALFVELSLPEPDPAVTAEIATLKEEANRVAQAISNLRFTRRNADDSELTGRLVEVVEKLERLEEEAYGREPRTRLFRRGVHVVDGGGDEYRPGGYATQDTYESQMRFRRGSAEQPFTMLASSWEDAGYAEGASEQEWVLLFRLPPTARDLTVVIENPAPEEGRPRSVAVPLGRP